MVAEAKALVEALADDGDIKASAFTKERDELLERSRKAMDGADASFDRYKELSALADALSEFKWKSKLEAEFNAAVKK